MNSAFVGYEELSRSRRVLSTEAEANVFVSHVNRSSSFARKCTKSCLDEGSWDRRVTHLPT